MRISNASSVGFSKFRGVLKIVKLLKTCEQNTTRKKNTFLVNGFNTTFFLICINILMLTSK